MQPLEPASADHHCHDHALFTLGCEACERARAAFLPYKMGDPHPPKASRSFGMTGQMGPDTIHSLTRSVIVESLVRNAVEEAVYDVVIDAVDLIGGDS